MIHPNETMLRDLYAAFGRGDLATVLGYCVDDITFHVPGTSKVAGTYHKDEFGPKLIGTVMQLSGGTFQEQVDDVLANDGHGVVLATHRLQRDGTAHEYHTAHVWTLRDGKAIEWREYPRDLHQFDQVWSEGRVHDA